MSFNIDATRYQMVNSIPPSLQGVTRSYVVPISDIGPVFFFHH
nr:MAG TPA: hypothetical protein [Caudoviricetes sp.]